jgi:hypothetical protein
MVDLSKLRQLIKKFFRMPKQIDVGTEEPFLMEK